MPIPDTIRNKRPKQFGAVEIRSIGGYFYVYRVSSKWDAAKNEYTAPDYTLSPV